MILAESIAHDINWTLIATVIMAVGTMLMWWDARKTKTTNISGQISGTPPDNAILARDLKSIGHRVKALEDARARLLEKMDEDKTEILAGGEDRARRIYEHIDEVRRELDEKVSRIPGETVALLKNTGAIGGKP